MENKNINKLINKSLFNLQKYSSVLLMISKNFDIAKKKKDDLDIGEKESIKEFISEIELYQQFLDYQKQLKEKFRDGFSKGEIDKETYLDWNHQLSYAELFLLTCIVQSNSFSNLEISKEEEYSLTPIELAGIKFNLRNENKFYIPFKYQDFANYKEEDDENGIE